MADDNFTRTTFYTSWKAYQDHLTQALAPLTTEQLALRAAPGLRSIGETPCMSSGAVHTGSPSSWARTTARR
jgi:hypothetical protein